MTLQPMTQADLEKSMSRGNKDRRPMNAQEMRQMAETADGYRDEPLYLVYYAAGGEGMYAIREREDLKKGDDVVLQVKTKSLEQNRIKPDSIKIIVNGKPTELSKDFDAAFWTESSIEKFLLPYYASARVLSEDQLKQLKESYNDQNVVALLHTWPTRTMALQAGTNIAVAKKKSKRDGNDEIEIVNVIDYLATPKPAI